MARRFGGFATVVVSVATGVVGLLLLGGVAPSPEGVQAFGDVLPEAGSPLDPTTTTSATTVPPTTISQTTTVLPTTSTPITTAPPAPSLVLISVSSPSQGPDGTVTIGAGSTVAIEGQCRSVEGAPSGPVQIWVVNGTTEVINTGVIASFWTYQWVAPAAGGAAALQVWCGDPTGFDGGYPIDLQLSVSIVDVGPPPTAPPELNPVELSVPIPETD
jgi:hypothetical protein